MISQLFTAFRHIKYYDKTHSYYTDGVKLTSVTTLIKSYQVPFDEDYWLVYKVLQSKGLAVKSHASRGVTNGHIHVEGNAISYVKAKKLYNIDVKTLKKEWKQISKTATDKGKRIHNYLENAWKNKYFSDHIKVCDRFIDEHSYLVPVALEFIVADVPNGVAGQFDMLAFNTSNGTFELYDYKTDKEIETSNRFQKFKAPLEHLDDCNFNKYIIQLNLYKWCLEKYTPVSISAMYIVHFKEDQYRKYRIPVETNTIKNLLSYDSRRRTINAAKPSKGGDR